MANVDFACYQVESMFVSVFFLIQKLTEQKFKLDQ